MWQGWCLTPGLSDTRAGAFSTILCYLGGSYSNKCQDILGDVFTGCASVQISATTFIAVDTFFLLKPPFSRLPPSPGIHGSCLSHFTKLRPAQLRT